MLSPSRTALATLGDAAGFTLIELLVAMVSATVVTGALFTVLVVSVHQTARISGSDEATQLGRGAMTRIVDELHSACIAREYTPIKQKSTANELIFVSATGNEADLSKAYLHKISYSSTKDTLVQKQWISSGEWPEFTFNEAETPTTTTLAEYITPSRVNGAEVPIFQYYSYASTSNSSSTSAVSTLNTTPLVDTGGLSEANAATAAAVQITFTDGAAQYKQYKPNIELSDQVQLSFDVPPAETPIVAKPCE